ncbi:MAG: sigma-70 family RNA polymerase sigma factor [Spirochaetales bacterium]|nr:sigma-70 family RNA polymerase sigma factor [Spirochaetales bacterium]
MPVNVEDLYRKYGPMVMRRCRQLLSNEEAALDAMQDTFVNVLRNKDNLKATYPSGLLYRIATNVCLNIIRKRKKMSMVQNDDLLSAIAAVNDIEEKIIQKDVINLIFQKEKVSTKVMAVMHYVDKMTFKEVASEVGLSVSGVRKRLRNLKKRVDALKEVIL